MRTLIIDHKNGHKTVYNLHEVAGNLPIAYDEKFNPPIVRIMENARLNRTRLRFHWGNIETGEDWGDIYDVSGYIGLSRGNDARFPILIHNSRSMGGGSIIAHIVKITESKGKRVLYQHSNYHEKVN